MVSRARHDTMTHRDAKLPIHLTRARGQAIVVRPRHVASPALVYHVYNVGMRNLAPQCVIVSLLTGTDARPSV